jgi:hypothetical protein
MILRRIPDLAAKVTADDVDIDDVIQVEADVVLRLVRNPEGYRSESDGTYTYEFNTAMASGKLEITREDWITLGLQTGRVFALVPNAPRVMTTSGVHPFWMGG